MRVTANLMAGSITRYLVKQNQELYRLQQKISSQKKILRPSDDPAGMRKVLGYRNTIATVEQYLDNVGSAVSRIEMTEINLDMAYELLGVVREMNQAQVDGTTTSRRLAADDLRNMYDQLEGLANSKMGNNYMFSGHQTDAQAYGHVVKIDGSGPADIEFGLAADASSVTIEIRDQYDNVLRTINPAGGGTDGINTVSWDGNDDLGSALPDGQYRFTITASEAGVAINDYGTYNGDDGDVSYIIGDNTQITMVADGRDIFSPSGPGKENVFEVLADLISALENDDRSAIAAQKKRIDVARQQISEIRATNSPKMYQLQSTESYWANYRPKIEEMLSKTEKADLNEAIMELNTMELAYQTTIATAGKIIQPGLINFLK
jgi:flagellin-like hook-associated protein FlgL